MRGKTSITLNLEKRKAEQEERKQQRLERENSRRSARGLVEVESLDSIEPDEQTDVLLNQAAEILTDLLISVPDSEGAILSHAEKS